MLRVWNNFHTLSHITTGSTNTGDTSTGAEELVKHYSTIQEGDVKLDGLGKALISFRRPLEHTWDPSEEPLEFMDDR